MRHLNRFAGLVAAGLMVSAAAASAERPLASEGLIRALTDEVSGEIAYRYTSMISVHDRIQASDGWRAAAETIKAELDRLGYGDAIIEGWPSDGTSRYYTYRSVIGWRAKKAELWMASPSRERLCSFEEVPLSLVKHSGSGHVETELVDAGSGLGEASYAGKAVKGKIVLATGATAAVMQEAVVRRGAVGVLTYFAPDTRPGYPNMIRYTALWPRWEEREELGFGFNISKNQGARLKRLLEEGTKVMLKADVDTEFYKTKLEILTASLQGSEEPGREILIVGHLCHPTPSANDNASGSGGMLEMARALKKMVDSGAVPPPRRTIRFLWVPEFMGTIPYIQAHLERTRNTLAAINCDMIGEDLLKTGGMFGIYRTPHSMPTYLNDVVANFAGLVSDLGLTSLTGSGHPFAWRSHPYSGGSDHVIFNDGALRVPSVMLNRGDTFHHTNLDSMDKVDPTELRRSCVIALGTAYYLAAAGDAEALRMARLVQRNGQVRFIEDAGDAREGMYEAGDPEALFAAYRHALNVIAHSGRREAQSVQSAAVFAKGKSPEREIAGLRGPFEAAMLTLPKETNLLYKSLSARMQSPPRPMAFSEVERRLTGLVPVRSAGFVCPLETDYLVEKLGQDAAGAIRLRGAAAYEALNFADGRRTVHDIALAVSAEFGPLDFADVEAFFRALEKAGLVAMKRS